MSYQIISYFRAFTCYGIYHTVRYSSFMKCFYKQQSTYRSLCRRLKYYHISPYKGRSYFGSRKIYGIVERCYRQYKSHWLFSHKSYFIFTCSFKASSFYYFSYGSHPFFGSISYQVCRSCNFTYGSFNSFGNFFRENFSYYLLISFQNFSSFV